MRPILLIDFGSTYTKVTAVDVDNGVLLGTSPHIQRSKLILTKDWPML